jgi:hypothetical protein
MYHISVRRRRKRGATFVRKVTIGEVLEQFKLKQFPKSLFWRFYPVLHCGEGMCIDGWQIAD